MNTFRLDGMNYQHIKIGDKNGPGKELIDIINQSAYNTTVYTNLETFFQTHGYSGLADEVFVALKRRERMEILQNTAEKCWNLFLDISVRFGRSPGRALNGIAAVIAFGCILFWRKNNME